MQKSYISLSLKFLALGWFISAYKSWFKYCFRNSFRLNFSFSYNIELLQKFQGNVSRNFFRDSPRKSSQNSTRFYCIIDFGDCCRYFFRLLQKFEQRLFRSSKGIPSYIFLEITSPCSSRILIRFFLGWIQRFLQYIYTEFLQQLHWKFLEKVFGFL